MEIRYRIAFIGAGNVAWHLAPELENAGHQVTEVYSRNKKNAAHLVKRTYNATLKKNLDFRNSSAEIFIIAVSDNAIAEVAAAIQLPANSVVVHTSGGQPIDRLGYASTDNIGVFYPLQTFSKGKKVDFREIPLLIEAENDNVEKILKHLAASISGNVYVVDSESRKAIHVSAVFSCNLTNYLLIIAKIILEKNNMPFDLLKPLINETIEKGLAIGPEKALTGPAIRGDLETLDRHMDFLKNHPEFAAIYKLISQNILDFKYSR